jgi:Tol biopolymer transport system component
MNGDEQSSLFNRPPRLGDMLLKPFIKLLLLGLVLLTVSGIDAQDTQPSWLFYQVSGRPTSPGTARFVYRMDMENGETVPYGMGDINISPNGQHAIFLLQTGSYYTREMIILDLTQEPPPDGFNRDAVEGETISGYGDWHPAGDSFAIFWQPDFKIVNVDGSASDYKLQEIYPEALEDDYVSTFEGKWSPNGEHMLMSFYGSQPMNHGLYLLDVAGKKLERISDQYVQPVSWLPDGEQAIVTTKTQDQTDTVQCISLVTIASGEIDDIYCEEKANVHLRYRVAPDGLHVLLQSQNPFGDYFLRVVDVTQPDSITPLPPTCCLLDTAQWSPDGSRIAAAFSGSADENEIMVMNADGSGLQTLAHTPDFELAGIYNLIEWNPDGTELVFSYQESAEKHLLDRIQVDGTSRETIAQTEYAFKAVDWIPQPHD